MLVYPHPYKVLSCHRMCWEENESLALEETSTVHMSMLYPDPSWSSHSLSEKKPTCSHVISKTLGILLGKWGHCPSSCLGLCALKKKWHLCGKTQWGGMSRLILYSKYARSLGRSSSLGCTQPGGGARCWWSCYHEQSTVHGTMEYHRNSILKKHKARVAISNLTQTSGCFRLPLYDPEPCGRAWMRVGWAPPLERASPCSGNKSLPYSDTNEPKMHYLWV